MILLVNFGGPRDLDEIAPFLTALLTDRDVIRTKFPDSIHRFLFSRVARKRAIKIREDYAGIGGRSPIYFDTENLAKLLSQKMGTTVLTFHRYLPETHAASLAAIESCDTEEIRVLPLFPQFSYATTGSIARFFSRHLKANTQNKLRWIKSYPASLPFLRSLERLIGDFLKEKGLASEEAILLFSAHGLPQSFIDEGDVYQAECLQSFKALSKAFPTVLTKLSYQSKFGPGEWIRPYTDEVCENVLSWSEGRKQIVIVPLSFTSDHIETLYEIEKLYVPVLQKQGLNAYRCPALNLEPYWIDNLAEIAQEPSYSSTSMLVRK